jgi:hypothetical protein
MSLRYPRAPFAGSLCPGLCYAALAGLLIDFFLPQKQENTEVFKKRCLGPSKNTDFPRQYRRCPTSIRRIWFSAMNVIANHAGFVDGYPKIMAKTAIIMPQRGKI